ncbi:hypothetical protein KIN20_029035 [Parelaphostrongylus tenuis]|uniref:Uncharacterized protein n=1 Tax=Parelaphostrongylus tenuis TaxID=148309 RepID=A0AAD5R221_PARTN|nr:hypothetical protein KIN20_029035 [Parelaphostrongylus tenuis]
MHDQTNAYLSLLPNLMSTYCCETYNDLKLHEPLLNLFLWDSLLRYLGARTRTGSVDQYVMRDVHSPQVEIYIVYINLVYRAEHLQPLCYMRSQCQLALINSCASYSSLSVSCWAQSRLLNNLLREVTSMSAEFARKN